MTAIKLLFFPSILQIPDASDSDLAPITLESEFMQLMCEAGETRVVTVILSESYKLFMKIRQTMVSV